MLVIEGHPNILSDFNNNSNTDTHVHTCRVTEEKHRINELSKNKGLQGGQTLT